MLISNLRTNRLKNGSPKTSTQTGWSKSDVTKDASHSLNDNENSFSALSYVSWNMEHMLNIKLWKTFSWKQMNMYSTPLGLPYQYSYQIYQSEDKKLAPELLETW